MKRFLIFLLILPLLLCGCQTEPTPLPPANFTGTVEGYTYYHESERDRKWEEDIITLAELYVTQHPWLVNDTTNQICMESYASTISRAWVNQYIPEKYDIFLSGINQLIPRIPEYNDNIIQWELQRVFASLGDCHAAVFPNVDETFPLRFFFFHCEDGMSIVTVSAPTALNHLLYTQLTAINSIPIEEILERMRPYSSFPLEEGFLYEAVCEVNATPLLIQPYLLQTIGILDVDSLTADFTFLTDSGEFITETITAISSEELDSVDFIDHSIVNQLQYSFSTWNEENLWMEYLEEKRTLYVRIYSFRDDEAEPMLQIVSSIRKLLTKEESIDKFILDLRCNPGGHPPDGYNGLINLMGNEKVKQPYILINEGSFSMSALAVYNARTEVPHVLVMGAPSGQELPCGTSNGNKPNVPNHQIRCGIPGSYVVAKAENVPDRIVPDILIYPTLDDYKNGVDTLLEAVLDME